MDWWQTLLVAVVAPAVTAGALLWQTRINNARDDRRRSDEAIERKHDRDASAAHEAQVRRHALRDHWREERKEAHTTYLAALESANGVFGKQLKNMSDDEGVGLNDEDLARVREALATVQMLSLPATRLLAEAAFRALTDADANVFIFGVLCSDSDTPEDALRRAEAEHSRGTLRSAHAAYLDAVRAELGTEE